MWWNSACRVEDFVYGLYGLGCAVGEWCVEVRNKGSVFDVEWGVSKLNIKIFL